MTLLLQLLSEFRAGRVDQAQLLARAASLLTESSDNLEAILVAVQEEHARQPLPLGTFVALRKHLHAASAPKTIAITPAPGPSDEPTQKTLILAEPPPAALASPPPTEEQAAKQAIGATLGERFKLIEFVGAGGTARLYKAIDLRKVEAGADDPHVAVKVLTLPQ